MKAISICRRWSGQWRAAVLLSVSAFLLSACAAPRYATEVRYAPPATEAGMTCLKGCHVELQACQADCQSRREACIAGIEPRVDAAFEEALKRYELERRHYMRERQFYQLDQALHFGFYHHPFYYGYPGYPGPFWSTDRYWDDPPVPPVAPDRAVIRAEVIDRHCNEPCGCQEAFDQCYVDCGGQVERRVVCIENCREGDPLPNPSAPEGTP
ncbi:MAG: hypothetical protein ACLFMY_04545 [Guyparkeria sp.]|uniref:hypothetical protein n=1 Tax=Guyparkeria sp. TaxID=2035736 RepID=UPI00397D8FDE